MAKPVGRWAVGDGAGNAFLEQTRAAGITARWRTGRQRMMGFAGGDQRGVAGVQGDQLGLFDIERARR